MHRKALCDVLKGPVRGKKKIVSESSITLFAFLKKLKTSKLSVDRLNSLFKHFLELYI